MPQNLPPLKTLEEWLDYISRIHHQELDLGLERVQAVGIPPGWHRFPCPIVTVAGTNGKGSCVRFLENIYTAAGYRVGSYTSPHLMAFNERVRIANQNVDDAVLITAFETVEIARGEISLSFFEYTFLAALVIFQHAGLDLLILEVGLGGRLDAVNLVDADIAVITTIDLDHTDRLGPDRESIANEKAGIFRRNQRVVCGDPQPPPNLHQRSVEIGAHWYALHQAYDYSAPSRPGLWEWQGGSHHYQQLPALILKPQNAAASLMVVELLQDRLSVSESALRQGLAQASLEGRFEKIPLLGADVCYVDVAHNPQGGRWLAEQWAQVPVRGRRLAILGMLSDKDVAGTIQSLLNYVDSWYVAMLTVPRGAPALQLQAVLSAQGVQSCSTYATVEAAVQAAMADANRVEDAILVFGSFYTVAAARQFLLRSGI